MGFDLGIALGAGVEEGVNTYRKMNEEKRQQAMFAAWQKEQDDKQALTDAAADTLGRVGQPQYEDLDTALYAQNVNPNGTIAAPQSGQAGVTALGQRDAEQAFTKRAYGINFEMGRRAEKEGLEISNARRQDTRGQAEDDFSAWHQNALKQIQEDPVEFIKTNLKAYNEASKGSHLDDGKTGEVVKGADGSFSFVQKDTKGSIVSATPITQQTAMSALKELAFAKYSALPGKYKDAAELGLKAREVGARELSAQADMEYKGKGGVMDRYHQGALGIMGRKQTAGQVMEERADAMADAYVKGGVKDPATGEPFASKDAAKAYAYQQIVKDPNLRQSKADQTKEEVDAAAQDLFNGKAINPQTKKPFASIEEATAYAWQMRNHVKQPGADWKMNPDMTMRSSADGSRVQQLKPGVGWVDVAQPQVNQAAAAAGVKGVVDAKGRSGFQAADGSVWTTEKEAFSRSQEMIKKAQELRQGAALDDPAGQVDMPPNATGPLAPKDANERFLMQLAWKQGFQPLGRSGGALGGQVMMFENPKTGQRLPASAFK